MIDRIEGIVSGHYDKSIQVSVHGIGILLYVAKAELYPLHSASSFLTYLHWNQERGPSLYGFTTELERSLFLYLIDVPKIGPSLALQLMSQATAETIITLIQDGKIKQLSNYHGLGEKKAEQIVYSLKTKIKNLISLLPASTENNTRVDISKIHDVLLSLGYSKQEAADALSFIHAKGAESFDTLLRTALSYLSKNKIL